MANMPAVDKRKISVQLRLSTIKKIDKMAASTGLSRNALVNAILDDGTQRVMLTDVDMEEIRDEIRRNEENRRP